MNVWTSSIGASRSERVNKCYSYFLKKNIFEPFCFLCFSDLHKSCSFVPDKFSDFSNDLSNDYSNDLGAGCFHELSRSEIILSHSQSATCNFLVKREFWTCIDIIWCYIMICVKDMGAAFRLNLISTAYITRE